MVNSIVLQDMSVSLICIPRERSQRKARPRGFCEGARPNLLHALLHPNDAFQRPLRPLHVLHNLSRLSGILHTDLYGPRLLVHLEAAWLCLHRAQDGVEGVALEEWVFLIGDEGADERAFPAEAG